MFKINKINKNKKFLFFYYLKSFNKKILNNFSYYKILK